MRILEFQTSPVSEFRNLNAGRGPGQFHEDRLAGLGGIIGNAARPHRRSEEDYLTTLNLLLDEYPDVLLMHDGPDGREPGQRGMSRVREMLIASSMGLVIRGHAHWDQPFAEFEDGLQILNVDARVVVLTV